MYLPNICTQVFKLPTHQRSTHLSNYSNAFENIQHNIGDYKFNFNLFWRFIIINLNYLKFIIS